MAGMFYSLEEVAKKLNKTEEEVKELVKMGRLREFRDGPNLLFKVDEVESLMSDTSFMSSAETPGTAEETAHQEEISLGSEADETSASTSGPSESEEKRPAEESNAEEETASEESEAGEEEITLASERSEETTIQGDLTSADTTLTSEGINVLGETDSDYAAADDTQGETKVVSEEESLEEIEEDVNLDSFGSGSGLLDLSLQADDTSLGGILDDIYMSEGESEKEGTEGTEGSAREVAAEAEQMFSEETTQAVPVGATMVRRYTEPEPNTGSNLLGIMVVLPLVVVVYTVIVVLFLASTGKVPSILGKIHNIIFIILGAFLVVSLVMGVAGFIVGTGGAKSAKPKAKKEKKKKKKKKKGKEKPSSSPETDLSETE
ncbi:helix-turn-helix domain-containing protein [Planctomycetota bacterium]